MKTLKILSMAVLTFFLWGCSEDIMDDINRDRNNAQDADAFAILPDVILKTAYTATATDLAWYASAFVEHSAGQWAQHHDADRRLGLAATSHFNNHWNGMYDILNMLNIMKEKTSPGGEEENNIHALGIAQILTAYNLAVLTDFWGDVPWSEAVQGASFMKPKFDKQSVIYQDIFTLLDDGIANLQAAAADANVPNSSLFDYIYGGNNQSWIRAAYSLKARYHMRLSERDNNAASQALAAISNGFQDASQSFLFAKYEPTLIAENPWYQFKFQRSHLAVSSTLFDIMDERNDTIRMVNWFSKLGDPPAFIPAPPGEADRVQGGTYSESLITYNPDNIPASRTRPTPLMTYHELLFIQAEALHRTGGDFTAALQNAVRASFAFHGLDQADADAYFVTEVQPRLTANAFNEIMTQKYIAMYEHEASEAYHDYRRVRIPTLHNPNNVTVGFPERNQYGTSEESNNPDNFIEVNIYTQPVWWAGGTELAP
jgi:hypothetical protein